MKHKKEFGSHGEHHHHKHVHEHMTTGGKHDGNTVMHEIAEHLDRENRGAHIGGKPAPDQGRRD
jgi:hypothetical protein